MSCVVRWIKQGVGFLTQPWLREKERGWGGIKEGIKKSSTSTSARLSLRRQGQSVGRSDWRSDRRPPPLPTSVFTANITFKELLSLGVARRVVGSVALTFWTEHSLKGEGLVGESFWKMDSTKTLRSPRWVLSQGASRWSSAPKCLHCHIVIWKRNTSLVWRNSE